VCLLGFSIKNQFTDGGFAEGWAYATQTASEIFYTIERMNATGDFRLRDRSWSRGYVNNYWSWFIDHMLPGNYIANYSDTRTQQISDYAISSPYRDLPFSAEAADSSNKVLAYNNYTYLFPGNADDIDGIKGYVGKNALTELGQGYDVNNPILSMPNFKLYPDTRVVFWRTGRAKPSEINNNTATSHFALWIKGGSSKEGHKHRDEGQFAIYCGKKPIILESGMDYDITTQQQEELADQRGHNILQIGAKPRTTLIDCTLDGLAVQQLGGSAYLNLKDSYNSSSVTSYTRQFNWSHSGTVTDPLTVTVTDTVVFAAQVPANTEIFRFHTGRSTNSSGSTNPLNITSAGDNYKIISWENVSITMVGSGISVTDEFAMDFTQPPPAGQSSQNNPRYHRFISVKPISNINANTTFTLNTTIVAQHENNGG
jgi:hypothetical protein